ncbi:basic proline-rich protein-like [Zonotrichia leucophrys gambelii]|uniref:basic proline-rich protein-like n=1 Tax=Zonotrichia leucophrys gambelii TaxID=257770 RepID=UPI003140829B
MEFTTRFGLHSQATRLREAPGPARRGAATGLTPSAGCGLDHKDLGPPRAPPGIGASVASPKLGAAGARRRPPSRCRASPAPPAAGERRENAPREPPSRRREPKRHAHARGTSGRDGPAREDRPGGGGARRPFAGESEDCDGAPRRPETAPGGRREEEEEEEEGGPRGGGGRTPVPGALASRARGSTARYRRGTHPQTAARSGWKAGGEARASPSLFSPFLSRSLSLSPFSRPSPALSTPSLALPRRRRRRIRGAPRRGRAPPQRLAPGAGATERSPSLHLGDEGPVRRRPSTGGRDDDDGDARRAAELSGFRAPLAADGPFLPLAPRPRGRAPGFDRTSTRNTEKREKPTLRRTAERAGEPAPPTASPPARGDADLTCRLSEAAQAPGLGPASARRAGRRAPARGGARRPARSRFHGNDTTHGSATRPGARPSAPAHAGSPGGRPRRGGSRSAAAPPRGRLPFLSLPAAFRPLETARGDDRAAGAPPPGGARSARRASVGGPLRRRPRRRTPREPSRRSPAPEACRTADPAAAAGAALRHRRRRLPPPWPPSPRHAPGGRRTALSRGATPALLVFTRRPGGGSAPAAARTPSFGPRAAEKGDGGRDVRGPGRDAAGRAGALRPTVPRREEGDTRRAAPPPLGTGSPALAGLRRRRARGARPPGGRRSSGGGRPADGAAGAAFEEERP